MTNQDKDKKDSFEGGIFFEEGKTLDLSNYDSSGLDWEYLINMLKEEEEEKKERKFLADLELLNDDSLENGISNNSSLNLIEMEEGEEYPFSGTKERDDSFEEVDSEPNKRESVLLIEDDKPSNYTKIIQNPEKVRQLRNIVDEQKKHHEETKEEKYSLSDISRIIGCKDRTKTINTIKDYIRDSLYNQIFGHHTTRPKTTLNEIDILVKELGLSKSGIEGTITPRGREMFKKAIKGGNFPSQANIEVNCNIIGHEPWKTSSNRLKNGHWCYKCALIARSFTYEVAIARGRENGYYLKETPESFAKKMENRGNNAPSKVLLDWVCEFNHKNSKSYGQIPFHGCKTCSFIKQSITFDQAKKIAEEKRYSLSMTEKEFNIAIEKAIKKGIRPSFFKLKWSCEKDHTWPASYSHMNTKDKGFCPYCRSSYYESYTRRLFKKIFGLDFPTTKKRDVLRDGSHGSFHFDGYNMFTISGKRVKLAFEYNGHQHYEWPNAFHKSKKEFLRQRKYDKNKVKDCKEKKVVLIVVPHKLYKILNINTNTAVINHIIKEFERQVRIYYNDSQFIFDIKGIHFNNLDSF